VFDNVSSEMFGLKIGYFDSGKKDSDAGANIDIIESNTRRKSKPYFFGTQISNPLEIPMFVYSEKVLDTWDRGAINKLLFGRQSYSDLQIIQGDMEGYHYRCLLKDQQDIYIGNMPYAKSFTMRLDDSWAWTSEMLFSYVITTPQTIMFNNMSDDTTYLYPVVSFTLTGTNTGFKIQNITDGGRTFEFTALSTLEYITVDNYRQIITSSTGLNRVNNFNLNFFRLLSGFNELLITGSSNVVFRMKFAKKIGG
jgi:hypothetical protein